VIKPKKSLGQNFLIDNEIIEKITNIIEIKNKNILEIGPGTGNLTASIIKKTPNKIIVIEKDEELAKSLKKNFGKSINIINNDVLKINEKLLNKDILSVFGNLPYNISTEILCKWIKNLEGDKFWFDCLILMFQKEVADRIISKYETKNYGRLSILANWKLNIRKIFDVKPSCFYPKPDVESSVLLFEPKDKFFELKDPKNLEKLTRIFFMHRRKMLKKPFNQLFAGNLDIATKHKINLNLRPQNLNFDTYYKLTAEYEKLIS
tara:strand:+ start:711 stop:1499 length:789 start_codon:yes stop_codon:yes gene_type:complete